jgi:hypothetical protein
VRLLKTVFTRIKWASELSNRAFHSEVPAEFGDERLEISDSGFVWVKVDTSHPKILAIVVAASISMWIGTKVNLW